MAGDVRDRAQWNKETSTAKPAPALAREVFSGDKFGLLRGVRENYARQWAVLDEVGFEIARFEIPEVPMDLPIRSVDGSRLITVRRNREADWGQATVRDDSEGRTIGFIGVPRYGDSWVTWDLLDPNETFLARLQAAGARPGDGSLRWLLLLARLALRRPTLPHWARIKNYEALGTRGALRADWLPPQMDVVFTGEPDGFDRGFGLAALAYCFATDRSD